MEVLCEFTLLLKAKAPFLDCLIWLSKSVWTGLWQRPWITQLPTALQHLAFQIKFSGDINLGKINVSPDDSIVEAGSCGQVVYQRPALLTSRLSELGNFFLPSNQYGILYSLQISRQVEPTCTFSYTPTHKSVSNLTHKSGWGMAGMDYSVDSYIYIYHI